MKMADKAKLLVNYVDTLQDFQFESPDIPYYHMGATITDAMLQAGLNYNAVVKPRVERLLKYPEAVTTSGFFELTRRVDIKTLLTWGDSEKPNRILAVTNLFINEKIETEKQLAVWLGNESNLSKLDDIKGVGNKTLDYFKMLSDIPTPAIDRHLSNFLTNAGISFNGYTEAKEVISKAADLMGKDRSLLDHSIWKYMSSKKKRKTCVG